MAANQFQDTTATRKIFSLTKRIRAVSGGTSASKTISILIWLIDYAQIVENELISVVSESYPHLLGGAMLDFERIMKAQNVWEDERWVRNPRTIYTFSSGTKIEFVSIDEYGKAHGPRRDVLFINECNNLEYKIVDQLITRTRKIVWLDWNPTSEFWFYTDMKPNRDDIDFITLTYKDNEALSPLMVKEIEDHKYNKQWWKVYGEGQLGDIEGRIFTDWKIIEEVPHPARLEIRGLDFGYTNDPTAIVDIYYQDGGYILDELLFQKGMLNKPIADIIFNQQTPQTLVIADSAEPKSIDELKLLGLNITGAEKGADSVRNGIALVQAQRISITSRSLNIIREYRNYMWATDRSGNYFSPNQPEHAYSHSMDAIRYGLTALLKKPKPQMVASPIINPYYENIG